MEQLTHLFKALSDATRLRVVNLLHARTLCVGDLQELLGLPQPIVSQQLAILRSAKLVRTQRRGPRVFYSLCRSPILNYPLGNFLSEVSPLFPELSADSQKLEDFKGDSVSECPP